MECFAWTAASVRLDFAPGVVHDPGIGDEAGSAQEGEIALNPVVAAVVFPDDPLNGRLILDLPHRKSFLWC